MSAQRALIAVLLCCGLARAQTRDTRVVIHVVPSHVTLQVGKDKGGYDRYEVESGRPFHMQVASQLTDVIIEAEGWEPFRDQVHTSNFLGEGQEIAVWPRGGGEIKLKPKSTGVWLGYLVSLPSTWAGLLALVAAAGSVAFYLRKGQRHREQIQQLQDRTAHLEEYRITARQAQDMRLGSVLGDYRIVSRIGAGGMASVYKGVPNATLDESQCVAIKILSSGDEDFCKRFRREVRYCAELNHPNLTRLLDSGEEGGELFLVMEFIDGHTLGHRFRPQMPLREALGVLSQVVAGLTCAHARGLIHRDLKPDNIMITRAGVVKVMDFGLAQKFDSTRITAAESIVGTPAYMAPEQLLGEDLSHACDQYAFGMLCYQMLCNRLPFQEENLMTLITAHLTEQPPSPRLLRPDLPEAAESAILRMLAKKAGDRFPTLEAAWKAFESGCNLPPK